MESLGKTESNSDMDEELALPLHFIDPLNGKDERIHSHTHTCTRTHTHSCWLSCQLSKSGEKFDLGVYSICCNFARVCACVAIYMYVYMHKYTTVCVNLCVCVRDCCCSL